MTASGTRPSSARSSSSGEGLKEVTSATAAATPSCASSSAAESATCAIGPSAMRARSPPSESSSSRPSLNAPSEARDRIAEPTDAKVARPAERHDRCERRRDLVAVGGHDRRDLGLQAHQADVLEREVGDAVVPVVDAASDPDDADREP